MIHVESIGEIRRLAALVREMLSPFRRKQRILVRVNPWLLDHLIEETKLTMAGQITHFFINFIILKFKKIGTPTPFGIDEKQLPAAVKLIEAEFSDCLELCGFHVHAKSHQTEWQKHADLLAWILQKYQTKNLFNLMLFFRLF